MSKQHDTIAKRLTLILLKFNNGERFTINDLCEEFNVNKRTIQRDLSERLDCLPISKENGYYYLEEYALGKLNFKDIQSFATLSGIKSLYPNLNNEFIIDILNSKINKAYLVKNNGFESISNKYDSFELLSKAILKYEEVLFSYKDKQRTVQPYKLVNNNGIWYLLGSEEDKLKNFTFTKIAKLKIKEEKTFKPIKEFLDKIEKNDTNWFSNISIEVTLEINNKVKEYFLNQSYLPNQQVLQKKEDSIVIKTNVSYDYEVINLCMHWLPHIKILSPLSMQEKLENILKNYLNMTQPVIDECHTA